MTNDTLSSPEDKALTAERLNDRELIGYYEAWRSWYHSSPKNHPGRHYHDERTAGSDLLGPDWAREVGLV